jgi:hypothetical protein
MRKPPLANELAKELPQQQEPAEPASAAKPAKRMADDGKMTTSLRIKPAMLAELKLLALQQRVRVNDVILEAIVNHLALHGRRAA